MKNNELKKLIDEWFYSDLDIEFIIIKNNKKLYATLESDVSYYHERGPNGLTIKSTRIDGNKRKLEIDFATKKGNKLIDELCDYCGCFLNKDEMFKLLEDLENKKYKLLTYNQYEAKIKGKNKFSI